MEKIFTLEELPNIVEEIYNEFKAINTWAFFANMGCGKTTFIYNLCKFLQVEDEVSSPTFSIINQYQSLNNIIYHMDWYRLKNEAEAIDAGVEEIIESGKMCLIEWPTIAPQLLPPTYLAIDIKIVDTLTRHLKVTIVNN